MNAQITGDTILVKYVGGPGFNNAHVKIPSHAFDIDTFVGRVVLVGPGPTFRIERPDGPLIVGHSIECPIEIEIGQIVIYRQGRNQLFVDGEVLDMIDSHGIIAVIAE